MGESDFLFVVSAPSFAEWGTFMDGYEDSPHAAHLKTGQLPCCE